MQRQKLHMKDKDSIQKIETALEAARVNVSQIADFTLVPRGDPIPDKGIVLVYDADHPEAVAGVISALQRRNSGCTSEMVVGKRDQGYTIVPIAEIHYFVANGNYVYGQTHQGSVEINRKLFEIERDYRGNYFFRIHKSYVINIRWVREIIPWFGGRLLIRIKETDEEIEVSRNYVKAFKEFLGI